MTVSELIQALSVADLGDMPVHIGWTERGSPGPVVAFKIFDDRVELRCQRIEDE